LQPYLLQLDVVAPIKVKSFSGVIHRDSSYQRVTLMAILLAAGPPTLAQLWVRTLSNS